MTDPSQTDSRQWLDGQQLHACPATQASRGKIAELLARDTGRPVSEVEELIEYDKYYSAAEAAAIGLIDRVSTPGHFATPTPTPAAARADEATQTADAKADAGTPEPPGESCE